MSSNTQGPAKSRHLASMNSVSVTVPAPCIGPRGATPGIILPEAAHACSIQTVGGNNNWIADRPNLVVSALLALPSMGASSQARQRVSLASFTSDWILQNLVAKLLNPGCLGRDPEKGDPKFETFRMHLQRMLQTVLGHALSEYGPSLSTAASGTTPGSFCCCMPLPMDLELNPVKAEATLSTQASTLPVPTYTTGASVAVSRCRHLQANTWGPDPLASEFPKRALCRVCRGFFRDLTDGSFSRLPSQAMNQEVHRARSRSTSDCCFNWERPPSGTEMYRSALS